MSKLWHDVQAVRVQPLELPVGRLKQIGLIIATAVTAALCIQGLILNHESRKLTQSRISLSQAETLLTSGAGPQVMLSAAEALELTSPEAARLAISLTHASLSQQPQQPSIALCTRGFVKKHLPPISHHIPHKLFLGQDRRPRARFLLRFTRRSGRWRRRDLH